MQFTFKKETYRLWFHYQSRIVTREIPVAGKFAQVDRPRRGTTPPVRVWGTLPGRKLVLTVTEKHHTVSCLVQRLETVSSGVKGWITQREAEARCSLKDQYRRKEGRAKALGYLLKTLWREDDPDLARAVEDRWADRFEPIKTEAAR